MNVSEMIENPISTHKYKIYDIEDLPKALLCVSVKNRYDECRLSVAGKYKPRYISHFCTTSRGELQPMYYYGIELDLKRPYLKMIDDICTAKLFTDNTVYSTSPTSNQLISYDNRILRYRNILHQYDVTCNTCYGYFTDGVCPIDMSHLQKITAKDYSDEISSGFTKLLDRKTKQEPVYSRVPNFNRLILTRSSGYDC